MSADLEVRTANMAELDQLDPVARELAVTGMLDQCRTWLATAVEATEPKRISEFKAFVATIAEMTKQQSLSQAIQLDATEMVRRAERGMGIAIRKGQEEGTVRRHREHDVTVNQYGKSGLLPEEKKTSPAEFFSGGNDTNDTYAMTDGVSDEQFNEAIAEAKVEGNLARANVVRKIRGEPKPAGKRHELLRGMHHIRPERVIFETVNAIEGLCMGLSVLEPDQYKELDPDQAVAWAQSLQKSLQTLNRLRKDLQHVSG